MHPGYFRRFCSGVQTSVVLIFATLAAVLLCLSYIIGAIILWCVGIRMIFAWCRANWKRKDNAMPEAMPGQEYGDHWERAWELATLRNHGVREDGSQAHFHVVPFLKSKTGVDMQHLTRLTKARDPKTKSDKELMDVDGNLPAARIDLGHLSDMVNQRAQKKRKALLQSAKPEANSSSGAGGGGSHTQVPRLVPSLGVRTAGAGVTGGVVEEKTSDPTIRGSVGDQVKSETAGHHP